jgi:hypothetical protein
MGQKQTRKVYMSKAMDDLAAKTVDRFFSSFQKELEIVCLKNRLDRLERTHGYQNLDCAEILSELKDALERQGRNDEADALVDRAGRIVLEEQDATADRRDVVMDFLTKSGSSSGTAAAV